MMVAGFPRCLTQPGCDGWLLVLFADDPQALTSNEHRATATEARLAVFFHRSGP
jgi:hypothetical protein